jgi:cellulose synthase/poly-beta-1,6-N-acetylglucosamine synthase-like glycosyltransferase
VDFTPPWLPPFLYVLIFCAIVDFAKIVIEITNRVAPRAWTSDPTLVTAVIPSRNGRAVIAKTIESLTRLLPPERILVVDDGSTDGTADIARALGCEVHRFERSKGKAGAINYAVYRVRTPYTLLLDDDTRLGDAELPTSLLDEPPGGSGYDAVAFHVLPDRRDREGARGNNFLGRVQRYEYGKSMEIGRRFHDATRSVSCVSGAVGLFKTRDLDELHHLHTGAFPGEDLQRSLIHLLNGREIVFVNQAVWTVAPWNVRQWLRQRLWNWYPAMYHSLFNFFRVLARRRLPFRLKYEMLYNLYTVISDPLKVWSVVMIVLTPGLLPWLLWIYLMYLLFELYPWLVVRVPKDNRRAPPGVWLAYPLYGGLNTLLRFASLFTWFWMRHVTGVMKPRRGREDRIA